MRTKTEGRLSLPAGGLSLSRHWSVGGSFSAWFLQLRLSTGAGRCVGVTEPRPAWPHLHYDVFAVIPGEPSGVPAHLERERER